MFRESCTLGNILETKGSIKKTQQGFISYLLITRNKFIKFNASYNISLLYLHLCIFNTSPPLLMSYITHGDSRALSPSRSSCRFLCCWGTWEAEVSFDKRQVDLMVLINCNKYCPNEIWDAFPSGSVSGLFLHYLSFLIVWYSNSPTQGVPTLFVASS